MVRTNGLEFGVLEAGEGPLAVCLHGFPDSAHTWRHLLPALAEAGFHAVALHHALDGDGDAVLIGHEWGAEAANGAAAFAPDRWRRVVTLGVPPLALDPVLYSDYQQLKRFFYLFWFRDSLAPAAEVVAASHQAQQPTLYLHGSLDGCIGVELVRGAERHLAPGSRMIVVEGAGHFPQLEQPEEVNEHILAWATG
jgi:pimeloyl-ACP methyl ester carboxylesterase